MGRTIYDGTGREIGYVCSRCHKVFPSMFGNYCNVCREESRRDAREQELLDEIKRLNNLLEGKG